MFGCSEYKTLLNSFRNDSQQSIVRSKREFGTRCLKRAVLLDIMCNRFEKLSRGQLSTYDRIVDDHLADVMYYTH